MTEADFLDQLAAWALGGLADADAAAMERYLAEHPALRPEVKRAFAAAAALGRALPPSPPPPGAWRRLEVALADAAAPAPAPARPSSRRWTALAWAIAAVAAALALWLWRDRDAHQRHERSLETELAALRGRDALVDETVALLELAGTQIIPLDPARPDLAVAANAIYHRGVKRAYIVVKGLPADAAGYQIWVNRAGQRLAAGRVAVDRTGAVIASVAANSLDDVPESFEVTGAGGDVLLQSHIKI